MSHILGQSLRNTQLADPRGYLTRPWFQAFTASQVLDVNGPNPVIDLRLTLAVFANNAAAIAGGLIATQLYRTGADPDVVCVVH